MLDKKYISLQYWYKILSSNGSEFQNLFSSIMEKKYSEFLRIKPNGKFGDGGNDGYIPTKGIYYQVYSPENPSNKSSDAAKKLFHDFEKLYSSGWNQISKIKEYHFVFNDKKMGVTQELERTLSEMSIKYPNIKFEILLPIGIEAFILSFNDEQLTLLGFDLDKRKIIEFLNDYLNELILELDKGHAEYTYTSLEKIRDTIYSHNDDSLILEFEIIEARTLQRLDRYEDAKSHYLRIYQSYPRDVRAPLHLAELYLMLGDFSENLRLLDEVSKIDKSHWLYPIMLLVRKSFLNEGISFSEVNVSMLPSDAKIKSDYYRIYGNLLRISKDLINARTLINKAIQLNPNKLMNHDALISLDIEEFIVESDDKKKTKQAEYILKRIDFVINKFGGLSNINARQLIYLNYRKFVILGEIEKFKDLSLLFDETMNLIFNCSLDINIDNILTDLLFKVRLSIDKLSKLIEYIGASEYQLSKVMAKRLFIQFLNHNILYTIGKRFYKEKISNHYLELAENLEHKEFEEFISNVEKDPNFLVMIFNLCKQPDLRSKIIDILPDNKLIQKDKLNLLMEYEAGNIEKSFNILKKIDLSNTNDIECYLFLEIAIKLEAWDFVLPIAQRLLTYENSPENIVKIKMNLFMGNLNLNSFIESANIGEEILNNSEYTKILSSQEKSFLLQNTIISHLNRNSEKSNIRALNILEKNKEFLSCFNSNAKLASEVYLRNNDPKKALESVITGLIYSKRPSPHDYASLFMVIHKINNKLGIYCISEDHIEINRFVKFKDEQNWYYIGNEDSLDANLVPKNKHDIFLNKNINDRVNFANKFATNQIEKEIEFIFNKETYVIWQTYFHFNNISKEGMWDTAISIEIPENENGGVDFKNLTAFMKAKYEKGLDFFNAYCNTNLPFALLVASEGDIPNAIDKIINHKRGFIRMSDGTLKEFNLQKQVATNTITKNNPFYLDGTSAWLLAETGLLKTIIQYIPNIKIPQSVINLLLDFKERVNVIDGEAGKIIYSNGKIGYSDINPDYQIQAFNRISELISFLESDPNKISVISNATKEKVFSEQNIPAYLVDATIFAQNENTPVLTEDYLYLHLNELETKKSKPQYFSLLALMRVLYDQDKISFTEYLDFFSFLASYRFNFLHINLNDLEIALLGKGTAKIPNVDNLKKFHFYMTLSNEYGVNSDNVLFLLVSFLFKLSIDNSISSKDFTQVFFEITSQYPIGENKEHIKRAFVYSLERVFNQNPNMICGTETHNKIKALKDLLN